MVECTFLTANVKLYLYAYAIVSSSYMQYMPISTVLFVSGSLSRDCSDKVDYQCCIMAGELYSVATCHNL